MVSSTYARMSASKAVHSWMKLALRATRPTPHGSSRLVQAIAAWSVKTRRVPSRHGSDARVYGHTTAAMHDNEYTTAPAGYGFFSGRSPWLTVELDYLCGVEILNSHKENNRITYCLFGEAPKRRVHSIPIAVSGNDHTRKIINQLDAVIHMHERLPHKRPFAGCSSLFTRLVEYLTAFCAWCKQCLSGR